MVNYKVGVEFGTNVGVLTRDMAQGAQSVRVFGADAATGLKTASVAGDELALSAQRVVAAQTRLAASQERLNVLQASGRATQRELSAAQSAFVASQERLLTAQTRQVAVQREAQAVAVAATRRTAGIGVVGVIGGLAATEGALKIKDAIESGAKSAAQLEAINRQIDSTLTATGNLAGTSVAGIDAMSEGVSKLTGISEDATRGGALLELTFTGIRNQGDGAAAIFDRAQQTAANMAIGLHLARGGAIDYQAAMQQLGRALNDPVAGMTLLTRAGVSFTASQKEQIKTLAGSGHTLQAQEEILTLVNQKYSDATKNYANTADGAYAQVRESLDQLERKLASPILSSGVPVLHALRDFLDFMTSHPQALQFGEVAVGLTGLVFAAATVEKAFAFMSESRLAAPLLRMLFPLRSVQRGLGTLAAEEDTQAVAAERAATAQNGLAAAYDRTAVAAGAAAEAQGAAAVATDAGAVASGAGAAGAAAGGAGLLARLFAGGGRLASGATLAAGLIDPVVLASIFAGGEGDPKGLDQAMSQQGDLAKQFRDVNGTFYAGKLQVVDPKTIAVLQLLGGQVKGGHYLSDPQLQAFSQAHPDLYNYGAGGQTKTTTTQNKLLANVISLAGTTAVQGFGGMPNISTDQLTSEQSLIGGVLPSLIDAPSTMHADKLGALATADRSVAAAQRRYAAAQRAVSSAGGTKVDPEKVTAAQDRLTASEQKLQELRLKHGTTASQIARAEASIASARAALNKLNDAGTGSTDRLTKAEDRLKSAHDALLTSQSRQAKAAHAANAGTALSAEQVTARFRQNLGHAQDLDKAQRSLATQGLSQGVIEQLDSLEKTAPGTLQRVARSLTPAMVKALNAEYGAMQKAQSDFLEIPFQAAALHARAVHAAEIKALAESDLAAFGKYYGTGAGAPGPSTQHRTTSGTGRGPERPQAFADGGWVPGSAGAPLTATVHGGEYVLSRAMLAGRQPIGVQIGASSGATAAPAIHVHVHTSAPQHVKHETNIERASFDDTRAFDNFQRRQRASRAVWN